MKTRAALVCLALASTATTSPALARPGDSAPAASRNEERAKLELNVKIAGNAASVLARLSGDSLPKELTAAQRKRWDEQSAWLEAAAKRMQAMQQTLQKLMHDGARQPGAAEMASLNKQFLSLQNALQSESKAFEPASAGSKARHDIAMNAIRNLKG